jgi:3-methylcrotonyl-CoA carboxylase alpha subunit
MARVAAALFALQPAPGSAARHPHDHWQRQSGFRFMAAAGRRAASRMRIALDDDEASVSVERLGDGWRLVVGDAEAIECRAQWPAADQLVVTPHHGIARRFTLTRDGDSTIVNHQGTRWRLDVSSEVRALARVATHAAALGSDIRSEMPGAITAINVKPGDAVEAGDVLVVMEAMKLIFPLAAPRAGTVASVRCTLGDIVPRGQTLVQLDPVEATAAAPQA